MIRLDLHIIMVLILLAVSVSYISYSTTAQQVKYLDIGQNYTANVASALIPTAPYLGEWTLVSANTIDSLYITNSIVLPYVGGHIKFNHQGTLAYVGTTNGLYVINVSTSKVLGNILPYNSITGIALNPTNTTAYIGTISNLTIFDLATNSVTDTMFSGNSINYIALNLSGTTAYVVTNGARNKIQVVNTVTDSVGNTITIPSNISNVSFATNGNPIAYATTSNGVYVIDTATNSVSTKISVNNYNTNTTDVVFSPTGYAYVSSPTGIYVINTSTNTVKKRLDIGFESLTSPATNPSGSILYVYNNTFNEFGPGEILYPSNGIEANITIPSNATNQAGTIASDPLGNLVYLSTRNITPGNSLGVGTIYVLKNIPETSLQNLSANEPMPLTVDAISKNTISTTFNGKHYVITTGQNTIFGYMNLSAYAYSDSNELSNPPTISTSSNILDINPDPTLSLAVIYPKLDRNQTETIDAIVDGGSPPYSISLLYSNGTAVANVTVLPSKSSSIIPLSFKVTSIGNFTYKATGTDSANFIFASTNNVSARYYPTPAINTALSNTTLAQGQPETLTINITGGTGNFTTNITAEGELQLVSLKNLSGRNNEFTFIPAINATESALGINLLVSTTDIGVTKPYFTNKIISPRPKVVSQPVIIVTPSNATIRQGDTEVLQINTTSLVGSALTGKYLIKLFGPSGQVGSTLTDNGSISFQPSRGSQYIVNFTDTATNNVYTRPLYLPSNATEAPNTATSVNVILPSGYPLYLCAGAQGANDIIPSWNSDAVGFSVSGSLKTKLISYTLSSVGHQKSNTCDFRVNGTSLYGNNEAGIAIFNTSKYMMFNENMSAENYVSGAFGASLNYTVSTNKSFVVIGVACGYVSCDDIQLPQNCYTQQFVNYTDSSESAFFAVCPSQNAGTYSVEATNSSGLSSIISIAAYVFPTRPLMFNVTGSASGSGGGSSIPTSYVFNISDNINTTSKSTSPIYTIQTSSGIKQYNQNELPAEVTSLNPYINVSVACSTTIGNNTYTYADDIYGLGIGIPCGRYYQITTSSIEAIYYKSATTRTTITTSTSTTLNSTSHKLNGTEIEINLTKGKPYDISINSGELLLDIVSENSVIGKLKVENLTDNLTFNIPNGLRKLLIYEINLSSNEMFNASINATLGYNCSLSGNNIAPYIYQNGTLIAITPYTLNQSRCTVRFGIRPDPIIALLYNTTTPTTIGTTMPTTSVYSSNTINEAANESAVYEVLAIVIIIIAAGGIASYILKKHKG